MKNLSKKFIMVIIGVLMMPSLHYAQAVSLSLINDTEQVPAGGMFRVDVMIDTEQEYINLVNGTIQIDPQQLHIENILTGNSIVPFWVDTPAVSSDGGSILFSGVIPGGISLRDGYLFSIIFSSIDPGTYPITMVSPNVYLHDGEGTLARVTTKNLDVRVVDDNTITKKQYTMVDKTPPEKFTVTRVRDPNIFDNAWFIVFTTQDKNSAVNKYQVCEFLKSSCLDATSPHLLAGQSPWYAIRVTAIDHMDNTRHAFLISKNLKILFTSIIGFVILSTIYVFFRKKVIRLIRK